VGSFETVLELPSDRETLIRRTFRAPAELVFDAWTIPDQVRRWYGLAEFDMTVCEIDLRVGGHWRWVQASPDGYEVAFSGVYRHIDRPQRLTFTEVFEPMPGSDFDVEMTFDEVDGHTTVTTVMTYQSREHRDGHLQSGMEDGTRAVHLRLDELFADLLAER
jgi:uncharacterized protein YndB with AHSA1/START domain